MTNPIDALLIVSFGGPDESDDVIPFLENVLRGRNVPRERMLEVAEHYYLFGGKSPLNDQIRELFGRLRAEFGEHQIQLPIYWGNRNWRPMLTDTMQQMANDGINRAVAFVTSGFSCYSGCRQYREDIANARQTVGASAPAVHKLRVFYDHPLFVQTMIDRTRAAIDKIPPERINTTQLIFTAHSIPFAMAESCSYQQQLLDCSRWVASGFTGLPWKLVFQSRSGPPTQAWLEPDVGDYLRTLAVSTLITDVVLVPLGFTSDHMEVQFDLDNEARQLCQEIGLNMVRASTPGTHPSFISMIRELVEETIHDRPRIGLDSASATSQLCGETCCWSGRPGFVPHDRLNTTPTK